MPDFKKWYDENKDRFDDPDKEYRYFLMPGQPYAYDLPQPMKEEELREFLMANWVNNESELENIQWW